MRSVEFTATICCGVLVPPLQFTSFLRANDGKQARVVLSWHLKKRTTKQNRFWFGCCIPVIREWLLDQGINLDAEETHEFCVRHVWKHTEVVFVGDVPFERRLSSTKLSTKEWEERIEVSREYFGEKGLPLPYPNEASQPAN
jgi:hypothetical protein